MELVILLLLINLLGLGFVLFWGWNFSRTYAETNNWYKKALEAVLRDIGAMRMKQSLTKLELRKVHMLCHQITMHSFNTNKGMLYLHSAVGSKFNQDELREKMSDFYAAYVADNFNDYS